MKITFTINAIDGGLFFSWPARIRQMMNASPFQVDLTRHGEHCSDLSCPLPVCINWKLGRGVMSNQVTSKPKRNRLSSNDCSQEFKWPHICEEFGFFNTRTHSTDSQDDEMFRHEQLPKRNRLSSNDCSQEFKWPHICEEFGFFNTRTHSTDSQDDEMFRHEQLLKVKDVEDLQTYFQGNKLRSFHVVSPFNP